MTPPHTPGFFRYWIPVILDPLSKIFIAMMILFVVERMTDSLHRLTDTIVAIPDHEDQYKEILQQHIDDQRDIAALAARMTIVEDASKDATAKVKELHDANRVKLR